MFAQNSQVIRGITAIIVLTSFILVRQRLQGRKSSLSVTSSAFNHGDVIPSRYTCDGEDISPALSWDEGPENTASYVLICDDPDAPRQNPWVHWVVYNIPANTTSLDENIDHIAKLPDGSTQAMTDFGHIGYGGPCPPPGHGIHRYYFKIYALDQMLSLDSGSTKADVEAAMNDHLVAEGVLMGTYERN